MHQGMSWTSLKPSRLAGHRLWGGGSENRPLRNLGSMTEIFSTSGTQEQRVLPVNPMSQRLFQKHSRVFTEKPQAGPLVTLTQRTWCQKVTKGHLTLEGHIRSCTNSRYSRAPELGSRGWVCGTLGRRGGAIHSVPFAPFKFWTMHCPVKMTQWSLTFLKRSLNLVGPMPSPLLGQTAWEQRLETGRVSCLMDPAYHRWHHTTMPQGLEGKNSAQSQEQIRIFPRRPWQKYSSRVRVSMSLSQTRGSIAHERLCFLTPSSLQHGSGKAGRLSQHREHEALCSSYSTSLLEMQTSSVYSTWVDPRIDGRAHKSETQ